MRKLRFTLFLLLFVAPAFADSIPMSFTGVSCDGSLSSSFLCSTPPSKGSYEPFVLMYAPNGQYVSIMDGYSRLTASIVPGGLLFASSLDTVFGTFTGNEFLPGVDHGIYEYAVSGTYLLTWTGGSSGTAEIVITSSVFMGRVGTTPEPGTIALLGSGLLGIATAVRKRKSVQKRTDALADVR